MLNDRSYKDHEARSRSALGEGTAAGGTAAGGTAAGGTAGAEAAGERVAALHRLYGDDPAAARIVKRVRSGPAPGHDPFHGTVAPESRDRPYGVEWRYGIDRAVGGLHDAPNPGEMLCGALAACADGTLRMLAGVFEIELEQLEVEVTGEVDVRGALAVERDVPVGFQRLGLAVRVRAAPGTSPRRLEHLATAAERLCIVLDTLRHGVPVDVAFDT
jgi:uncharacterized OsmC-like protein